MKKVIILIPVYNDWESLKKLITEINENLKGVLVLFLANKNVENIFIIENAGRPKEK